MSHFFRVALQNHVQVFCRYPIFNKFETRNFIKSGFSDFAIFTKKTPAMYNLISRRDRKNAIFTFHYVTVWTVFY